MSSSIEANELAGQKPQHDVAITVNERPVIVHGPKTDGLAIKLAAMAAGLPITTEFVLSQEKPNGDTDIIGDTDELTVNKNSRFVLLHADDNS
jgi:hypothetical protein